ncbi:MAG TPA: response regulator [Pseudomonadales bacterium]|nr:response regulator [Pseudomonadales bacterium]
MANEVLTPTEVAELLAVSPVTVRQWAQKGLIEARTTPGGHRRFTREAVIDFAHRMAMTLPEGFDTPPGNRVLIVDDDRQFNGMLVALFKQKYPHIEVAFAYDGFEAGRQVLRFKPTLVLLDIMMPGMDGVDVCRAIKSDETSRGARVIAMTGHHTRELEQRVITAGAERLLKKPFGTDELLAVCGLTETETVQRGDTNVRGI